MPAVKTFAMFATVAIVINFILQMTAFVSMLALDAKRVEVIILEHVQKSKLSVK